MNKSHVIGAYPEVVVECPKCGAKISVQFAAHDPPTTSCRRVPDHPDRRDSRDGLRFVAAEGGVRVTSRPVCEWSGTYLYATDVDLETWRREKARRGETW